LDRAIADLLKYFVRLALMNKKNLEKQVVSKQRVADHGEVYTSQREVRAMLNLVRSETERIDSRFLEPACGYSTL
jgi:type I restriction-modification system DNA methylase subunit